MESTFLLLISTVVVLAVLVLLAQNNNNNKQTKEPRQIVIFLTVQYYQWKKLNKLITHLVCFCLFQLDAHELDQEVLHLTKYQLTNLFKYFQVNIFSLTLQKTPALICFSSGLEALKLCSVKLVLTQTDVVKL